MKAELVWKSPDDEVQQNATVLVTPDELATLRHALANRRRGISSASLRTCGEDGSVRRKEYLLRYVLSITPLMGIQTPKE